MNSNQAKPGALVLSVLAASKSVRGSQKRKVAAVKKPGIYKDKEFPVIIAWLRLHIFKLKEKRVIVIAAN